MQHNSKDPMNKLGPEAEKALFDAITKLASGHEYSFVVGATVNVLVNAIRQNCSTRPEAERMFDELMGRAKNLLLTQHYDPVTNRRRNIFPYTQVVHAQLVNWNEKL